MGFEIKQATRTGIKPLVGIYGKSGGGKTLSALYLARGLAGPSGKIVVVDSENGRGSIFADIVPGGYGVIDIDAPFSPDRYQEAIVAAEKTADVIVVDTLSHEWSGEGGVLDMADAELERMGGGDNNKMRSWIKPKLSHKMMVQRLLRCKCALICCLRGEEKTHMTKPEKQGERAKVITDEFSTPLYDQRFIFEMLINFEAVSKDGVGGYVIPRKLTHPDVAKLIPKENEQIGVRHGEALALWCANPGKTQAQSAKQQSASDELSLLKKELWSLTKSIHGENRSKLAQHLWDENIMSDSESLDTLTIGRLKEIIAKFKVK